MGAFPTFLCELDIPTRAEDLAKRYHNKYAKEALFDAVVRWQGHDKGFKARFTREAKTRFHHFERQEKYKRFKARKYHSTMDLVKTGKSRERMLNQAKIQIGGSAEGGNITVTVTMQFDFKGGTGNFRKQGTQQEQNILKMKAELEDCDQQDAEMIAKWTIEGYMKRLNAHRSTRKRIRLPKR
jgi:hypothetical protein